MTPGSILKISKSFGCDLDGAMRETCKHFSSAKRKHLEKSNRREPKEKYTSTSWAGPRDFWLRRKLWKQGEEGRALWRSRAGSEVRGVR